MQAALLFEGNRIDERVLKLHIELNAENAGWLLAAPGMSALAAVSNDLRRLMAAQSVASPFAEHREFANQQLRRWKPYENMERGVIPADALMADTTVGIQFYYLPDLKVIDTFGLTDKTVARHPVTKPNHQRVIAHDRRAPPGYLRQRGVNFTVYPAASSADQALERGMHAVAVGPGLWMPFDFALQDWVAASFAGRDLKVETVLTREYVASLLGGNQPSIHADFDLYIIENRLVYVKEPCRPDDVDAKFFLHLAPVNESDLPKHRQQYGFDNLDFPFRRYGALFDGVCLAQVPLPEYGLTAIRTGQYIPTSDGSHRLWEGEIRFGE